MTPTRDPAPAYELTLFVNGASDRSARAIGDARSLCEEHLTGRYSLAVIDVNDDPTAAVRRNAVVAAPTLIKNRPEPVRRVVGDLSHSEDVLEALELPGGRHDASG